MFKKLTAAIVAVILCISALTSCGFYLESLLGDQQQGGSSVGSSYPNATLIGGMLDVNSYYDFELSDEALSKAIVLAYQQATGDIYAHYYTAEEYAKLTEENKGDNQGVGITIIQNTEYDCIEIISVLPGSPAESAGLRNGDLIVQVGIGENAEVVSELGYEMAVKKLQGVKGTTCEFGIVRPDDLETIIEFSIVRDEFVTESVMYAVSLADPSVGIVKILNFDLTTPSQFCTAMDALIEGGCSKFVYDLRYNPGGDLASISAVLSYFLNEDDVIVITEDCDGRIETDVCQPVRYSGDYSACNVAKEDIGKYRKYESAVLVNGSTASAAELFTGTLKTYGLTTVVGETTYGKGCMQSIFPLAYYGSQYSGAIKMTTKYYRPYNMDNYHGVGITPSEGYTVKLSDEASSVNIYKLLTDLQPLDNQLAAAISSFGK